VWIGEICLIILFSKPCVASLSLLKRPSRLLSYGTVGTYCRYVFSNLVLDSKDTGMRILKIVSRVLVPIRLKNVA
jgi:hypothetical protein